MFDVLEHLPIDHAEVLLAHLRSALSPQGAILLRVPNGDSPFGGAYQHGDRTHVETYGSEKLWQLCVSLHLEIVHAGEAPWGSQHRMPRTVRTFVGSVLKCVIDSLIGYAYFSHYCGPLSQSVRGHQTQRQTRLRPQSSYMVRIRSINCGPRAERLKRPRQARSATSRR